MRPTPVPEHQGLQALRNKMSLRFNATDGELGLLKWMLSAVMAGIASLIRTNFF